MPSNGDMKETGAPKRKKGGGKKRGAFPLPIQKSEKIAGWIWLPIHAVGLVYALQMLAVLIEKQTGIALNTIQVNLIYYTVSFLFVLVFMFRFLRESFADLTRNFLPSLEGVVLGYVIYYAGTFVISMLLGWITNGYTNPNNDAVFSEAVINPNAMKAVGIFLAPVVEEVLFRGVAFGTVRRKNRVAAYIVSAVLFSAYHLWAYIVWDFNWSVVLYLLQYVPASLALCWCYEKGRNLWAPIFLHMLVNLISLSVTLA